MKAAVIREVNAPMQIEELRDPEPMDGEVLIKVAACGVCHSDLHIQDGSIPFPMPVVIGHEISGTVVGLGPGVDDVSVGDRVVGAFIMPCGTCRACRSGREQLCEPFFAHNRRNGTLYDGNTRLFDRSGAPVWMYSMGGLSELAVVPAHGVARVPDRLPLADSAIVGCALMTAYGATMDAAQLEPAQDVAVIGAGGVGMSIVQMARALDAGRIVAVDIDDAKLVLARTLGATDVVNASVADPVAAVQELTDSRGVDVVFEAIGNPVTFRQATNMVADGGRCVMIGIAAPGVAGEIEITRLVRRRLQVIGSLGGRPRHDMAAVMELAGRGALDIQGSIGGRFTLETAAEAYGLLAAGEITGRAVVEIGAAT
jgi:S-(hydroxymethyl)glutathione dehydrogenase/alcohol dehydrogenase